MSEISVIIPAHNEENYILPVIKSIKSGSIQPKEIIVVCAKCSDNTVGVLKKLKDPMIKVLETSDRNIAQARNTGARHATGLMYTFLDADTCISENTLREVNKIDERTVATLRILPDNNKFIARTFMFLKNLFFYLIWWYPTSNGIIIASRKFYKEIGGFDESLKFHEDGIFVRSGKKLGRFKFITKAFVITSMRRYEQKGYLMIPIYWTKDWVKGLFSKKQKEYEVVR